MKDKIFAGIEAGGTKFVCAIGSGPDDVRDQISFPTTDPRETITRTVEYLQRYAKEVDGIGIASFGPLDPRIGSPGYGRITATPKPGWSDFDVVGAIKQEFLQPIGFDTDVNGAALGEWRWGGAQGLDTFIYLTIGTGIGGGAMVNGSLVHGLLHPEMGHMMVPHDPVIDPFPGSCPFHGDCLEGLANGPAIEKRWGSRAEYLAADHLAWELEANYLAFGLVNLIMIMSPQRIILGGGVMQQTQIFPLLRKSVLALLNDYVQAPEIINNISSYIIPPALGSGAGVLGAISLAELAYNKEGIG